eukprot:3626743-Amphidinium_carterae.1
MQTAWVQRNAQCSMRTLPRGPKTRLGMTNGVVVRIRVGPGIHQVVGELAVARLEKHPLFMIGPGAAAESAGKHVVRCVVVCGRQTVQNRSGKPNQLQKHAFELRSVRQAPAICAFLRGGACVSGIVFGSLEFPFQIAKDGH